MAFILNPSESFVHYPMEITCGSVVVRAISYLAFRLLWLWPRGEPINCVPLECWSAGMSCQRARFQISAVNTMHKEDFREQTSLDGFLIYQDN